MPAPTRRTTRTLAVAAAALLAAPAPAQTVQPGTAPNGPLRPAQPKASPQPKAGPVLMPSLNSFPGVPAYQLSRPAFDPAFLPNPALNNPWMNQTTVTPVRVNPLPPLNNFNNPFLVNPLLQNPAVPNPLAVPGYGPSHGPVFGPAASSTPPLAVRQPGLLVYKGPDLQVNPASGTVYRPLTGTATLADGTTFYRVAGSGLPTAAGDYATGTGLYYNPAGGTFFNPRSGVVSQPGRTNVFIPYVW